MVLTGVGVVLVAILVLLAFDGPQKFFTLFAAGVALGAVYALVCLGFVVIYRATGIVNFAQVGMVVFGAFVTYNAVYTWGWSFWLSMLFSAGVLAVIGIGFERFALRRMTGKPIFSIILLTIGLYLLLQSLIGAIWTNAKDTIPNPWIGKTISLGSVKILQVDFVTMILGAVVLAGFFGLFRYTKVGLGMRATAIDQEAALAQGISVPGIVALSWAIAGAVAVIAGTMLGSGATPKVGLGLGISAVALQALPAMVIGGLDSPVGAVVGGLVIGIAYEMAVGYQTQYIPSLGTSGFADVLPYLLMVLVLLIRPSGLFGTRDVQRV
jgi:branched-chain amino acid transport system permease protein